MEVSRKNNFDALRLLFATFVVISHSFWINGKYNSEIFNFLTDSQIDLGALGVKGFFVTSGFLIFKSLERSKTLAEFYIKRFLRIYPALAVMCAIVMFTAPFIYHGNVPLLQNRSYWLFPVKVLSLFQFKIYMSGIFTGHPSKVVNMPLWTLCYEVSCYLVISFLWFIKSKKIRFYLLSAAFFSFWYLASFRYFMLNQYVFSHFNMFSYYFYDLAAFFTAGAVLSFFDFSKVKYRFSFILLLITVCALSIYFHTFFLLKYLFLPLIVILAGTFTKGKFAGLSQKFGDVSYGVYIYGWLIQQLLFEFFKLNVWPLTVFAIPLSYVVGWFSWNFVEKRALLLKKKRHARFYF